MSNVIPPLLSDSPPPIVTPDDEEDEFGDFNSAVDVSFTYESLSLPSTPQHKHLEDVSKIENFDINSNTSVKNIEYKNHINGLFSLHIDKDFQDKRKSCDITMALSETDVNLPKNQFENSVNNVNNYTNNNDISNEESSIENLEKIDDVLQKSFVPIDVSTYDECLEETNLKSEDNINCSSFSENVPCSNEPSLDVLKHNLYENSCDTLSVNVSINAGEDVCNTNIDSIVVPNKFNINQEDENKKADYAALYFTEEPPDLHVIDDPNVQINDIDYYDAYEEPELEHNYAKFSDIPSEIKTISVETKVQTEIVTKNTDTPDNEFYKERDLPELEIESNLSDRLTDEGYDSKIRSDRCANGQDEFLEQKEKQEFPSSSENITNSQVLGKKDDNTPSSNILMDQNSDNHNFVDRRKNDDANDEECNTEELDFHSKRFDIIEHLEVDISFREEITSLEKGHNLKELPAEEGIQTSVTENRLKNVEEVDGFYDFSNYKNKNNTETIVIESSGVELCKTIPCKSSSDVFFDFAKFDDAEASVENMNVSCIKEQNPQDMDGVQSAVNSNSEDDEFGDFGDYTQPNLQPPSSLMLTATASASVINKDEILKEIDNILLKMYPGCETHFNDFVLVDVLETDLVFRRVKDVTDTNALIYQWANSTSQDRLLKALNIDTRNILYGHGWNPMMPKYAANLGLTPLEPVKSSNTILLQNNVTDSVEFNPATSTQVDIPSAQFDWNGSGLINPLDCHSTDEHHKKSEPDVNLDQLDKNRDTLTPVLRARFHSDNESVKSLQLTSDTVQDSEEIANKPESSAATFEEEFDEFTSYQSHKPPNYSHWSNTTLTLRETHISNEDHTADIRKRTDSERERKIVKEKEFTDPTATANVPREPAKIVTVQDSFSVFSADTFLQPALEPLKPTVITNREKEHTQINWPNPGITDADILNIELAYSRKQPPALEEGDVNNKIGVTTVQAPNISENLRNSICIEPLNKLTDQINLPNPIHGYNCSAGAPGDKQRTNDYKNKIVDNMQSVFVQSNVMPNNLINQTSHTARNCNNDDEDWSDFVCNSQPIKAKNTFPAHVPELRLSVPHLNELQQPKKPIPVITPQGLIQTRIPSNISNLSNTSIQQPSSSFQNQMNNTFQPSIISYQYQNHINGSSFNKTNVNGVYNGLMPQQVIFNQSFPSSNVSQSNNVNDDEDDWTDFISGPSVQCSKKPVNIHTSTSRFRVNDSTAIMPNIIANPVHFGYNVHSKNNFGAPLKNAKKSNIANSSSSATIPSISALPDLEFVAPKTRTFSKK